MLPETIEWNDGCLRLLDQRALPLDVRFVDCRTVEETAHAIETMIVRGAPAIGIAAAYGMALAARNGTDLADARRRLARTRPTAVNLFWALERTARRIADLPQEQLTEELLAEARAIHREDVEACRTMGAFGASLLPDPCTLLTHCNAGAIATGGFGTALGVVRAAALSGKRVAVYADETRPLLQGARLTAWELTQDGIPVTILCDGAAAFLMARRRIDAVLVGADRIAANGDTANKIGTYALAVAARRSETPFYVVAPCSTIDPKIEDGNGIPIEERSPSEIHTFGGVRVLQEETAVWNPAFDVTPAELITAIVTERGILRHPYERAIRDILGE